MTLSLSDKWDELTTSAAEDAGDFVRLRVSPSGATPVYAALRSPDHLPAILVEVSTGALPADCKYPQSRGFEVYGEPIIQGRDGKTRIVLCLTEPRYSDVFETLADDVVARIIGQPSESACIDEFLSRLARWQAFLQKHKIGGLSPHEQQGLYGELLFLANDLIPTAGVQKAVQSWTGPSGTNQDFQFGICALETKSTSSLPPYAVVVSNIRQLDGIGLGHLFLLHVALELRMGAPETLPNLVESIRAMFDDHSDYEQSVFEDRLLEYGYMDSDRCRYDSTGYVVRSCSFYAVRDGFPRIQEDTVPSGVGDVKYSVALPACQDYLADRQLVLETIKGSI